MTDRLKDRALRRGQMSSQKARVRAWITIPLQCRLCASGGNLVLTEAG
jgi:hypothetical protein